MPQSAINEFYDPKGVINANKVVTKLDDALVGVGEEKLDIGHGDEQIDLPAPPSNNLFDHDDIADLNLFWKADDIADLKLSCKDVPTRPIPLDDAAAASKLIWK